MYQKVIDHFRRVDPILYSVINKIEPIKPLSKSNNFFSDLCEAIINQQLSDKSAAKIFERFKQLFPKQISPEYLLRIPDKKIREAGASWKKVSFMKDLSSKLVKGEIKFARLEKLDDQEVIKELTKLKGIGRWTAEMFLMFCLAREDVFSAGDFGLKHAIQRLYQLKREPNPKQIEKIGRRWSPYRTYAALILWRISDAK